MQASASGLVAAARSRGTRSVMRRYAPYVSLAVFVALVVAGLVLGEFRSVLANAVNVCPGCIGIG